MLTRRDFTLILVTAVVTTGLVALAQTDRKPPMNSSATDWNSIEAKANANGSGKKFFEGPTPTLELLECHASTLNPGASNHGILERPDDEVIIIKEGTIEAYIKDKWVRVGPGSVIFNAANAPQSMRNTGETPATYHVVMFRPGAAKPAAK